MEAEEYYQYFPIDVTESCLKEEVSTECNRSRQLLMEVRMRSQLRNAVLDTALLDNVIERLTKLSNLSGVE